MSQDRPQFEDFELLVNAAREPDCYPVTLIQSPAGQANGTLKLELQTAEIQTALQSIAGRQTTEDSLRQFGQQLFDKLMADPIGDSYRKSQGLAQGAGKRLRVRLRLDPPEIAALPWEYLYDARDEFPLAISRNHCLSRYVQVSETVRSLQVELPLRVLVVVSDPSNLSDIGAEPLNAAEEIKRIRQALQQHEQAGRIKTEILPHAVAPDLRDKLREFRPHVVHFIGHGDQGKLVMEEEDHTLRLVSDTQFRNFFLDAEDTKLVLLNACKGAAQSSADVMRGVAQQVVRRGPGAVVAMQYIIPDAVSLTFAREFYRALAQYYPVDAAVAEGRRAVYMDHGSDQPDWGTPVIFMRSPDGVLFSPPQTRPEPAAQTPTGPVTSVIGAGANLQGANVQIGNVAGGDIISSTTQPATPVGGPRPSSGGQPAEIAQLVNILTTRFDVNELETLAFDLGLDWDNLEGKTRDNKIRNLVDHMRRYGRLPELANHIRQTRPDIQW